MNKKVNWTGRFGRSHIAYLDFSLHRVSDDSHIPVTGIIDTGFTGFVQIPASEGIRLGLLVPPYSVGKTRLANGALQKIILKTAKVTVCDETQDGICQIPLTANSPILIGMDFLRRFERMLIVSYNMGIHLVPEKPIS